MGSELLLLCGPTAVSADSCFWSNKVIQAAKVKGALPLRSCHRRSLERSVSRSYEMKTKIGNLMDYFTRQPTQYLRTKLCFK